MGSPLENPTIRYGMGLSSATILVLVAFFFLEGMMQWLVLGFAVVEAVLVPQFLKMSVEQASD
ncbi:hypothetical protein [Haladaptatus sp. DFWS20]|uniref:hypothetical protein n=1 Tax=Haladaptatus sp. DFWS20 TaxID=3403467 RepID=UPI003EBF5E68